MFDDNLGLVYTERTFEITGHKHQQRSPLLEGVLFSARFIISYQLCLTALTAALTIAHCIAIFRRRARARWSDSIACLAPSSSSSSSSSWRTNGRVKMEPPIDETTSLLQPRSSSRHAVGTLQRWERCLRSLFMMHPASIKDLHGNDTTAFILLLLGLNLFYLLYKITFSRPLVFVFADRAGLLFVANLPWLYLLAAKNQPFRLLTGTSYERLNVLHRGLGLWLAILAILHALGMVVVWYDLLLPRGLDFWWYLTRPIIYLGLGAFLCYQILGVTGLRAFRDWWYEMFLGCHIILQAGGLIFLFFHHPRTRPYVGIALVTFLIDRLWYRLILKTRTFSAKLDALEDSQIVVLSAQWPLNQHKRARWLSWLVPAGIDHGWRATDHVFLTVPALSRKHRLQAHPFTIASAPPDRLDSTAALKLLLRARSGFTQDLLQHAKHNADITIRLDGPYGSPHALEMLLDSDVAIVLAGGSGIAVAFPLVHSLIHCSFAGRGGARKICLIWIINDSRCESWLGQGQLTALQSLGLTLVMPPPTSKAGRPDVAQLLNDLVSDLGDGNRNSRTGLMVSGPDAMNRSARNAAARMARQGQDIHVAVEVFDW